MFVISHALFPISQISWLDLGFANEALRAVLRPYSPSDESPRSWKICSSNRIRRVLYHEGHRDFRSVDNSTPAALSRFKLSSSSARAGTRAPSPEPARWPAARRASTAPRQPHFVIDAFDGQGAFPKRIDEVQLSHIRLRERADAARIARRFGKEPAFVVVANRERGDARHVGDFADAEAWQRVVGLSSVLARVHRCPFRSCLE